MIDYQIVGVDNINHLVQIQYTKTGVEVPYFVNTNLPKGFDEQTIHGIAKAQAFQASQYWDNIPTLPEPFILVNPVGTAKPTVYESIPEYDVGTQELTPIIVEEENIYRRTFQIRNFTETELTALLRDKRNALLATTDQEALSDRNPSQEILNYRQALRDITSQPDFPYNVVWPILPAE